jgi:hypothetical protein
MERLLEYPDVGRLPLIELLDVCLGLILKSETSSTGTPVMQRTQLIFRVFGK